MVARPAGVVPLPALFRREPPRLLRTSLALLLTITARSLHPPSQLLWHQLPHGTAQHAALISSRALAVAARPARPWLVGASASASAALSFVGRSRPLRDLSSFDAR